MFRKVATPALTGISGAVVRSLPAASTAESTTAATDLCRVVLGIAAFQQQQHMSCKPLTALCTLRRFYVRASRTMRDDATPQPPPSSGAATGTASAASGASAHESALDVAMRVNKLKKTHQTGGAGTNKKEVELDAWQALNSLTEDQINSAEGKAVSLLLNSWAYFAKFWARGKDGPL